MANLIEIVSDWVGIYKIEKTDPVIGGDGLDDIANQQAHGLMKRTNYLKTQVEKEGVDVILAHVKNYTSDTLVVLHGCEISPTIPGSSTMTAGAIFYNGRKYTVPAATVVTTGSETLVFKLNNTVEPNIIYLDKGSSGSGIANYNSAQIIYFFYQKTVTGSYPNDGIVHIYTPTGCVGGIAGTIINGDHGVTFLVRGDKITASGMLFIDVPNSTADDNFESGAGYPIGFIRLDLQDEFRGKAGDNSEATIGMAIATNFAASTISNRSFSNSVQCPCKIDSNGDIIIKSIPRPGANKRVVVSFHIDYLRE